MASASGTRKYISKNLREKVVRRANGRFEYCRTPRKYSPQPFVIEHILPVVKGGNHGFDNLALSCGGCNGYKYAHISGIDPATGEEAPFFHPRKESWEDHFEWGEAYLNIIGVTPIGRATVRSLRLNRKELINFRRLLFSIGEHPPED